MKPTKTLEQRLADANARIAELEGGSTPAAPESAEASSGGETSPAPAASGGDGSGSESASAAPVPTTTAPEAAAAPAAAPTQASAAQAAPVAPAAAAPTNASTEDRLSALERGFGRVEQAVGRLGTQFATQGAETEPVARVGAGGETGNGKTPPNEDLKGLDLTASAFADDVKELGLESV